MIPASFDYEVADSAAHALSLLAEYGEDAKLLGGGHSLLPMMKVRLAQPAVLIDIARVTELSGITIEGDEVVIGATTRHAELAGSELLRAEVPILAYAAAQVGDPQIRHRGTIGGSLGVVQTACRENHGLQCGFCTPGMVMAATSLLAENPHPTEQEVREGLEGNFCRCTGYHNIVRAVLAAADKLSGPSSATEVNA